jgi:DNA-binding XRE family transcriptional regulator
MHKIGTYAANKMTAAEIRELRTSHELSQREFADIIGVSRNTIYFAEKYGPSDNTVLRIEEAQRKRTL